jgi:hypothetical protein
MRMAFGLVSLLVTLAIILLLFKTYSAPMLKRGKSATDDARQLAGRDENNAPVTDAIKLDSRDRNGQMVGAVVTDITPGSAIEMKYGLHKGDVIVELGQLMVRGNMSSADEARDFLLHSYQRSDPVVVMRGKNRLTLPLAPGQQPEPAEPAEPAADASATPDVDPFDPGGGSQPAAAPAAPAGDAAQASGDAQPQPPAPAPTDTGKAKQRQPKGGLEGQLDIIRNIPGQ